MKNRILVCLVIFLGLGRLGLAQGWIWQGRDNQQQPQDLVTLPGQSGILLLSGGFTQDSVWLYHLDYDGVLVSRILVDIKNYNAVNSIIVPKRIIRTNDEGISILYEKFEGISNEIWIAHFDSSKNILWRKKYDDGQLGRTIIEFVQLSNNQYLLQLIRGSGANIQEYIWLNEEGEFINKKDTIWGIYIDPYPFIAIGDTIVVVIHNNANVNQVQCFLGTTGQILWTRNFNDKKLFNPFKYSDGGIGAFYSQNNLTYAQKLSISGEIIFDKYLYSGTITSIIGNGNNGSVFFSSNNGFNNIVFFKQDSNGDSLSFLEILPHLTNGSFFNLSEVNNNGFLILGFRSNVTMMPIQINPIIVKIDSTGSLFSQSIQGRIASDPNTNCQVEPTETGLEGWLVRSWKPSNPFVFSTLTDVDGRYELPKDTGLCLLSMIPPNEYWYACSDDTLVLSAANDTIVEDYAMQSVVDCPLLEVDIATGFLRRCFDNYYAVRYCNKGTTAANDAYIDVELDPYLTFISATLPSISLGNNVWRFSIGGVPIGACGNFSIVANLDCDSTVLGQSHCVSAHIYPDSACISNPNWSGALVAVSGQCAADSVRFIIENIGTGDMQNQLDYVIVEDDLIFRMDNFQLNQNGQLTFATPRNGSTWRVIAHQEPNAPFTNTPTAVVEGCGTNGFGAFSLSYVPQFGEDDGDPFHSTDCQQNIGAFDPNDKIGYPTGVGAAHFIQPNEEIEYQIRFQNTGTDTAFTVVVRDTLSADLDLTTVRSGVSSHPYTFDIVGGNVLKFKFSNILLPDSNVNEVASHGFLRFRVRPKLNTALGTEIRNNAAIFFDFNAPVITNQTLHTLGKDFLLSVWWENPQGKPDNLKVFPNPVQQGAWLMLGDKNSDFEGATFEMIDVLGKIVLQSSVENGRIWLSAEQLYAGAFFFSLKKNGVILGKGKLVVE
jgi:uncharacterized repeat protein (TIGR01451 family)